MQKKPETGEDLWGHETGASVDIVALHPSTVQIFSAYTTTHMEHAHPPTYLKGIASRPPASSFQPFLYFSSATLRIFGVTADQ